MKQYLRLDGTCKRLLRPSVVEDQVDSFRMQLPYLLGRSLNLFDVFNILNTISANRVQTTANADVE